MAEMDRAVGIRRPIVQHEARAAARDLALFAVDAALLPALQPRGLALREIRLHRKVGLRQVDRVLVVGHSVSSSRSRCGAPPRRPVHLRTSASRDRETLLIAQLRHELHFDLATVQIAREIEHVRLEQRLHAADRRARAQARHPGQRRASRRRARAPRRRPAAAPAGARLRGWRSGNPSVRPSRCPCTTRPRIE